MKFLLTILFILGVAGGPNANETVCSFIKELPKEQVTALDWFFRNCIQSFGGYVLYGDKPICIEYLLSRGTDPLYLSEVSCIKRRAFEILRNWSKCAADNEYLFLFCNYLEYSHMIIINRKAFIKAVNDNLSLFRYVLGRTITAEGLLNELVRNQDRFYDLIKDDTVLLGILLGYGTNNSLIVSRAEAIASKENSNPTKEAFPFRNFSCREKPLMGFTSLDEEVRTLHSRFVYSRDIHKFNIFDIPAFGCEPESEETSALLSTYEKNRIKLIEISQQEGFLEKTLERIFANTSGKLNLPALTNLPSLFDATDNESLAIQFAEIVNHVIDIEKLDQKALLKSFSQGVIDRENEVVMESFNDPEDEWLTSDLTLVSQQIECCKNLIAANKCFQTLSSQKKWISLIPNGIVYKVLREGNGHPASSKIQNATFHISYRLYREAKLGHLQTVNQGSVTCLIPGIAHSLVGMKRGEERMLCIHPRYSYGVGMFPDPSNETLFVHLQLMDFEEGAEEAVFLPACDLEPIVSRSRGFDEPVSVPVLGLADLNNKELSAIYKNLLLKNQKLHERKFYNYGILFWNSIRQNDIPLELEEFCRELNSFRKPSSFQDAKQRDQFIMDFKCHIFQRQYDQGNSPPFLRYFLSFGTSNKTRIS